MIYPITLLSGSKRVCISTCYYGVFNAEKFSLVAVPSSHLQFSIMCEKGENFTLPQPKQLQEQLLGKFKSTFIPALASISIAFYLCMAMAAGSSSTPCNVYMRNSLRSVAYVCIYLYPTQYLIFFLLSQIYRF